MKTGVIRRIDDLGRIVIPKEMREILKIETGDPLEFYIENERICITKYSTADVVEVVRCKYCGYYDAKNQVCTGRPTEPMMRREPDWYCAGGVRRETDEQIY